MSWSKWSVALVILGGVLAVAPHARADGARRNAILAGLDLRTEVGTHPVRIAAGMRRGALDLVAVLDPMAAFDGQIDTDLQLSWRPGGGMDGQGWAAMLGWRLTAIGSLAGGRQLHEKLLLGTAAPLPTFWDGRLQPSFGAELGLTVLKHGGGLPSEAIGFSSARAYIDQVQFALWLRFAWRFPIGCAEAGDHP